MKVLISAHLYFVARYYPQLLEFIQNYAIPSFIQWHVYSSSSFICGYSSVLVPADLLSLSYGIMAQTPSSSNARLLWTRGHKEAP